MLRFFTGEQPQEEKWRGAARNFSQMKTGLDQQPQDQQGSRFDGRRKLESRDEHVLGFDGFVSRFDFFTLF